MFRVATTNESFATLDHAKTKKPKKITLEEGFLPNFKKLIPRESTTLPDANEILSAAPFKRIVVGLSGVSCGGKTTVAKALSGWLGDAFGTLIMQDDFYKPKEELAWNSFTNFYEFDEPEAVRMDKIVEQVKAWKDDIQEDEAPQVLVVEGTMIFTNAEIAKLCDLRYCIHVDFKTAEYRRSLRNYPIPDPPLVVAKNIWPKYIKHRDAFVEIAESEGLICKQIDGTVNVNHTLAGIIGDVKINRHQ